MDRKPVIINLFAGPGAGKSTTRAGIFNELKCRGIVCEEVFEWIKYKVYEKNSYVFTDQLYVFAKQRKFLKEVYGQVDVIVTDSPILLSAIYMQDTNDTLFKNLILREFNSFTNINYFIERTKPYVKIGRSQSEEEAKQIDAQMRNFLIHNNITFSSIKGDKNAAKHIADEVIMGMLFPQ